MMRIAVGTDHVGLLLKQPVVATLAALGVEVIDLAPENTNSVDFPDYAERVGRAIQRGEADRGILVCGSGIGMCLSANKMQGIRASVAHDVYSAHQGVEHDDMNVLCLGSRVIGPALAEELVRSFVGAEFEADPRFLRRVGKINALEQERNSQ
jgi:ribose 5-phosphate isomerase B